MDFQSQTTHIQDAKSFHLTFYPPMVKGKMHFRVVNYMLKQGNLSSILESWLDKISKYHFYLFNF